MQYSSAKISMLGAFGAIAAISCSMTSANELEGSQDHTIYGSDDRLDYYEAPQEWQQVMLEATAVIVPFQLQDDIVGNSNIVISIENGSTLGDVVNLCEEQPASVHPFSDQYVIAPGSCSGVLIESQYLLTAGHCLCEGQSAVFGFHHFSEDSAPQFDGQDIYHLSETGIGEASDDFDYSVCRLDRQVDARRLPVQIRNLEKDTPLPNEVLWSISYPKGIASKITEGNIIDFDGTIVISNHDVFNGSSGGPLLDAKHRLVALTSYGPSDFEWDDSGKKLGYHCKEYVVMDEEDAGEYSSTFAPGIAALCAQATIRGEYLENLDCGYHSSPQP